MFPALSLRIETYEESATATLSPSFPPDFRISLGAMIAIPTAFAFLFIVTILGFLLYIRKIRRNALNQIEVTNSSLNRTLPIVPPRPVNTMYLQVLPEFPEYETIDEVALAAELLRATDVARAVEIERAATQNTNEPLHYDYVTAPVELYQDAHGESHMDEGRVVDEE
jgi:hypothetical protein